MTIAQALCDRQLACKVEPFQIFEHALSDENEQVVDVADITHARDAYTLFLEVIKREYGFERPWEKEESREVMQCAVLASLSSACILAPCESCCSPQAFKTGLSRFVTACQTSADIKKESEEEAKVRKAKSTYLHSM